jgi:serine/threonine-protein kinase
VTLADAAQAGSEPAAPLSPGSPRRLGRYELYEEIGRGGMGAVLRGRDPDLDRDLAVKVLHGGADRPETLSRFVEEARIGGQLQHPGVVPVHELGRGEDGRPYFAMKLVQGRTLHDLLKERASPAQDLARFLTVFEQVCQTVGYAHSRGVIHRDLKPQNIMVGAFGEVQVMDWGLAKRLTPFSREPEASAAAPAEAALPSGSRGNETQAGAVLGTPAYMAPEQARGETGKVDERADVFGLGAILCEILTGAPPYAGATGWEVYQQALVAEREPALARLAGCGADAELVALARDCMSDEPGERPRDAGVVAARVTAYRAGVQERLHRAELERAAAQAKAAEARKRQRLTVAVALAGLLLLGLVGGGALWLRQQRQSWEAELTRDVEGDLSVALAAQGEHLAEGQAALERAEGRLAGGAPEALRVRVREVREEVERRVRDRDMLAQLDEARQQGAELGDEGFDYLTGARHFEKAFRAYGLPVEDLGPEEAARRVRDSALHEQLVTALDEWGRYRWSADKQDPQARRLWEAARQADDNALRRRLRQAMWNKDWDEVRRVADEPAALDLPPAGLELLAFALKWAGRPERQRAVLREALQRHPNDFWLNFDLGGACANAESPEYDEAVRYDTAALALRPDSVAAMNNLALVLYMQHRPAEAAHYLRAALRLQPQSARRHNGLGFVLQAAATKDPARRDEALLAEAVDELRESVRLQPDHAEFHFNLGSALQDQGKLDEALTEYRAAARLNPKEGIYHLFRGNLLRDQGKLRESAEAYREAVRLQPDSETAPQGLALVQKMIGDGLKNQKKGAEAVEAYREALRAQPFNASYRHVLGDALREQGRLDEAVAQNRGAACLEPDNALAHGYLAQALKAHGQWEEAVAQHREAARLAPQQSWTHSELGETLIALGRLPEAVEEYRAVVRLLPTASWTRLNLGFALHKEGKLAEAADEYREALRLQPDLHQAHVNLGWALAGLGDLAGAADAFRAAARLKPDDAASHFNLGWIAGWREDYPAAGEAYRQALQLKPDHAEAQINLAFVLQNQGRFADAAPLMRRGHELAVKKPDWRYPSEKWAKQAERLVDLDGKLPRFLSGEAHPSGWQEQADLGWLCVCKRRGAAAARFYADAFAARPELADDLNLGQRFEAAGAAARAGCGGQDGAGLSDKELARLRRQALGWLQAELTARGRQAVFGSPQERTEAQGGLLNWRRSAALAGVRGEEALGKLPEAERAEWRKFWQDAEALLRRTYEIK